MLFELAAAHSEIEEGKSRIPENLSGIWPDGDYVYGSSVSSSVTVGN